MGRDTFLCNVSIQIHFSVFYWWAFVDKIVVGLALYHLEEQYICAFLEQYMIKSEDDVKVSSSYS